MYIIFGSVSPSFRQPVRQPQLNDSIRIHIYLSIILKLVKLSEQNGTERNRNLFDLSIYSSSLLNIYTMCKTILYTNTVKKESDKNS